MARELGISRVTVRKYLDQAAPGAYDASARERPVWTVVAPRLEALLAESVRWTGGKQRLTATRLHGLLRAEGQQVGVTLVKKAVAEWRRQRREVMIPLTYRAGDPPGDCLGARGEHFGDLPGRKGVGDISA